MGLLSYIAAKITGHSAPPARVMKKIKFSRRLRLWARARSFQTYARWPNATAAERRLMRNARKRERQADE